MRHFTSKDVEKLFPNTIERSYVGGQIVVYEGDQLGHMFFVKKGALKNYDIDDNGSENILDAVGELSFFPVFYTFGDKGEVNSFYSTLDDTALLLIPIVDFHARMSSDIDFAKKVFSWFVAESSFIQGRIRGLMKTEGRMKVAQILKYLIDRHSKPQNGTWCRVKYPVSQQFLADLVGLTRETVSTIMKDFEKQKIIHYPHQMCLEIDAKKLSGLSGT